MKTKLLQAYEHLLVIRGTHYGLLTEEELGQIGTLYGLDHDDRARLRGMTGEPIPCEQLTRLMGQEQPEADPVSHRRLRELLFVARPTQLLLLWMHQIADDDDAIRVLTCIREEKPFAVIMADLGLTQEALIATEERLLHAYRSAYQRYRPKRVHVRRRRSYRDFFA